ncbi:MAG: tRNA 2-thiouridine(34) synthase MnmA [Thermodesulfobacteriota bacterium]|nr:tRNA 2-thiouridine(34) synthase MnmA [Thermodesulfobacteriota bacterium]
MTETIAIGLSGGVDSLVAGFILKQKYKNVFGIHFTTGYEKSLIDFSFIEEQLSIKIFHVDLKKIFENQVVDYFIKTYLNGKTPNPCLICNKMIKFGALYTAAENLGADLLATGHYAKTIINETGTISLLKGKDIVKEQSYFLSMLSPGQLEKAIFPLSDMTKPEVKEFAALNNLNPPEKKESQDICFINEKSFADFISIKNGITPLPGEIVTKDNQILGRHNGLHSFTIGQRRGIDCPGPAPYYVIKIDMKNNRLVVGFKEDLLQKEFYMKNLNWIEKPAATPARVVTKIRYSHKGAESVLVLDKNGGKIIFDTPQSAVTPGQGAVFYSGDKVLGAGIIK